jgi:Uncharacterised nucleotidyltransferase
VSIDANHTTSAAGSSLSVGRLIAKALAKSWLASPPPCNLSADELTTLAPLLIKSGAGALLWKSIRNSHLAQHEVASDLQAVYRLQHLESLAHIQKIKRVVGHLNSAGLDCVLMKGWSVARFYPEPGLRHYSDVDLCFAPNKVRDARQSLKSLGPLELYVDVHSGLGRHEKLSWSDIVGRAETVDLDGVIVRVLGAEDHLRLLCLHWLRHDAWNPIGLCDIAAALSARPSDFDWSIALGADKKHADWMACALGLANQLLGADIDGTPIAERAQRLPSWLIAAVLDQWETCLNPNYRDMALKEIGPFLRSPGRLVKELRTRWHYPIRATMEVRGSFDESSRAPYQLAAILLRWTELPRQIVLLIGRWLRAGNASAGSAANEKQRVATAR